MQQAAAGTASMALPSADEAYRTLMATIEPDLLLTEQELAAKYPQETEDQRDARSRRYGEAFAEYDRQYAQYMQGLTGKANMYVRQGVIALEQKDQTEEQNTLADLESAISNS